MNGRDAWLLSSSAIARHPLRTTLTTVGVVLGVGAVIAMVTLGASFEAYFVEEFEGVFSPDSFLITTGEVRDDIGQGGFFAYPQPIFTQGDVERIRGVEGVSRVFPLGEPNMDQVEPVSYRGRAIPRTQVVAAPSGAVGPDGYRPIQAGEPFRGPGEAVVSPTVANAMLLGSGGVEDVVGRTLSLQFANGTEASVEVAGVLEPVPYEQYAFIYVDLSYHGTTRAVAGEGQVPVYSLLAVKTESARSVSDTQERVLAFLEEESQAQQFLQRDRAGLDFITLSEREVTEFIDNQLSQFSAFIASIGVIALLVGSIGIANTMMVSVTERTREIGIMKATGATRRDVLQLFLVEALLVSAVGSALGVLLGVAMGYGLTQWGFFGSVGMPLTFEPLWFPVAVGAGVFVGLLAGIYPAWRAARMHPVEALRYE